MPTQPSEAYLALRDLFLTGAPAAMGLTPTKELPDVWAMLVEVGFGPGTATLVMVADGTTSLYTSDGGGTIGAGEAAPVAEATQRCLRAAQSEVDELPRSMSFPLPAAGRVSLIVLTYAGPRRAEASEAQLTRGEHALTGLWNAATAVLEEVQRLEAAMPEGSST